MHREILKSILPVAVVVVGLGVWPAPGRAEVIGFEDVGTALPVESPIPGETRMDNFWLGNQTSTGFQSGSLSFNNDWNEAAWGEMFDWSGFGYSRTVDTTTPGSPNQSSAITGGGLNSSTYAVGFDNAFGQISPTISGIPVGQRVPGLYVTNTTYAYLAMQDGSQFSDPFGGPSGTEPDWFKLTITGKNAQGAPIGTVDFLLADYQSAESGEDYIVNDWRWVDLLSLSGAESLAFTLDSSDIDTQFGGFFTPAYFAMDDVEFSAVPEPTTLAMLLGGISALLVSRWRRRLKREA